MTAEQLPSDVEEATQRFRRSPRVEVGVVQRRDQFDSCDLEDGRYQGVARGKVGVDRLAGHARRGGDLFHAGVRTLAEHGARGVDDGLHVAPGIGAASARRRGGGELIVHRNLPQAIASRSLDTLYEICNSYSMSRNRTVEDGTRAVIDDYDPRGIHVVEDGPRGKPSLLLIHGTAGSVSWWAPVLRPLAEHHHVIRVDLPGHGQSAPAPSYVVAEQANRIAAVLDEVRADPVVVVGHSSGGYVATALAEQHRDRVKAVALINSGPRLDALWPQPALIRALSTPPLSRLAWALRSVAARRALATAFTRPVDIPDDLVAALHGMTYRAFVAAPREMTSYLAERDLPDRLAVLDIPLLVVFGAEDHRWNSTSARFYDVVPGARIELLPGVGHSPMFEAPDATSKLLLQFAASC